MTALPLLAMGAAAAVGLWSAVRGCPPPLKQLACLWTYLFLNEVAGHLIGYYHGKNYWLYNIFDVLFISALAHILGRILDSSFWKRAVQMFLILFPAFTLANIIFVQKMSQYNSVSFMAGGVFIILLSIAYFLQLFHSEDTSNIGKDPFFFICSGLLVYFGGMLPFLGMYNTMVSRHPDFMRSYALFVVNSLSILLNLLILTGYLCRKEYPRN